LATALPEFRPPQSGGVLTPPTSVPTPKNNPAGVDVKQDFWQQDVSPNRPPARYDHIFAFASVPGINAMIIYGGRAQNTLGDAWIAAGHGWHQLVSRTTPPARFGAAAVAGPLILDAELVDGPLIFGGQSGAQFFNDIWRYDSPSLGWTKIATKGNKPTPRAGASVAFGQIKSEDSLGSSALIITHGYSDKDYFDDTFMLNSETNTWEKIISVIHPSKRIGQAGTFDARHGKLFLFGGQDVAGNLIGDLWELDPAKRTWTKITPRGVQPSPRSGASLTYDYKGRLWLFGGETANGVINELWMYDIASKQWSLIDSSNKPSARSRHKTACAYGGDYCYVFGGMDANGNALNDLWQFTP